MPDDATMLQIQIAGRTLAPALVKSLSLLKTMLKNGRILEGFKALASILLLALYLASGTGYELFHEHQSFLSHSAEEENDPCHRAIYHVEKDNACKHEWHLSKNEKCGDCYLLFHADQIIVRSSIAQSVNIAFNIKVVLALPNLQEIFLYHPSRAPPLT